MYVYFGVNTATLA